VPKEFQLSLEEGEQEEPSEDQVVGTGFGLRDMNLDSSEKRGGGRRQQNLAGVRGMEEIWRYLLCRRVAQGLNWLEPRRMMVH